MALAPALALPGLRQRTPAPALDLARALNEVALFPRGLGVPARPPRPPAESTYLSTLSPLSPQHLPAALRPLTQPLELASRQMRPQM